MQNKDLFHELFATHSEAEIVDKYLKLIADSTVDLKSQLQIQKDNLAVQKQSFDKQQEILIDMGRKLSEQSTLIKSLMVEELNRIDKGLYEQSNLIQTLIVEQLNEKENSIKQDLETNLVSTNNLYQEIQEQNKILEKVETKMDFSNGVWIDPDTGLMWSRISIGQKWAGGECSGYASEMTFVEAEQACQDLWLAGFHDWRLPTIEELQTLQIDEKSGFKHQEDVLYKPTGYEWGKYWSKSRSEEDNNILFINFNEGERYRSLTDTYTCYVRVVRLERKHSSLGVFDLLSKWWRN